MKKQLLAFSLVGLLLVQACPFRKQDGTPIKPSEITTAARSFAIAPVSLAAACDIVEVFALEGDIQADQAKKIYRTLDQVQAKLDTVSLAISSGKWDQETTRKGIAEALDEFEAAIKDGTFNIKNPQSQMRWAAWVVTIRAALNSIYQVADSLQPLPQALKEDAGRGRENRNARLSAGGISAIIAISTAAAIEVVAIRNNQDAKVLWQFGKDRAAAFHAKNAGRL